MAKPLPGVTTERTLKNLAVGRAIEEGAPLLQFPDALGGFLGVELRHLPVVQALPAEHRVLEVRLPRIP